MKVSVKIIYIYVTTNQISPWKTEKTEQERCLNTQLKINTDVQQIHKQRSLNQRTQDPTGPHPGS